jgi:large subunit ribosomal protein L6e
MVKTREELRAKLRLRKAKHSEANKTLNKSKWGYPVSDEKKHFTRNSKKPRQTRLRADIQPGQVLILLSGRFRGRRVVFLKQLPSGMLLVTGPYKFNGVPLKRVNQAYVLPTKTRVNLANIPALDKLSENTFFQRVEVKRGNKLSDFVEEPKKKRERITDSRRETQNTVDSEVSKSVREVAYLKEYLQNRFGLKNGDKPHLMNF